MDYRIHHALSNKCQLCLFHLLKVIFCDFHYYQYVFSDKTCFFFLGGGGGPDKTWVWGDIYLYIYIDCKQDMFPHGCWRSGVNARPRGISLRGPGGADVSLGAGGRLLHHPGRPSGGRSHGTSLVTRLGKPAMLGEFGPGKRLFGFFWLGKKLFAFFVWVKIKPPRHSRF